MSNYLKKVEQSIMYNTGSYLKDTIDSYNDGAIYEPLLSDNYDVFSEIDLDTVFKTTKIDKERLSKFVAEFKRAILESIKYGNQSKVMPKLKCTTDEDDALMFTWAHGFFRIFMLLEVKDEESYYGMYYRNLSTDEVESRSAKFPQERYFQILSELTNRVLEIL